MQAIANEIEWAEIWRGIPQALRLRKVEEWFKMWDTQYGVKLVGAAGGVLSLDITKSNPDALRRFFEEAHIAAVTVEPADIRALAGGKALTSLTILDVLQTDPSAIESLSQIEPDQIQERLEAIAWRAVKTVEPDKGFDPKVSVARMKAAGIDVPGNDDPYSVLDDVEPAVEPTESFDEEFGISRADDLFDIAENPNGGLGGFLE